MAEDREGKTEAASEKRLRRAFEEGQIPLGRDAVAVAGLAAGALALIALAPAFRDAAAGALRETLRRAPEAPFSALPGLLLRPAAILLLPGLLAGAAALAATLAQTRGGFWAHLALPDLSRLAQGGKISHLFSRQTLADLGIAAVKVVAIAFAAWSALRADFLTGERALRLPPDAAFVAVFEPLGRAAGRVLAVMAALAGAELALQRLRFADRMKMTRDELRREHKEEEGDPLFRSRRKRRHRDVLKGIARVEVPRADALLVNPTHVAVAIRYRRGEDRAPRITAKGKGKLAEVMRELARENGIPIVEDIPLARLLYKKVKIGREVPASTFKAVAAILAWVYRVTGRSSPRASGSAAEVGP